MRNFDWSERRGRAVSLSDRTTIEVPKSLRLRLRHRAGLAGQTYSDFLSHLLDQDEILSGFGRGVGDENCKPVDNLIYIMSYLADRPGLVKEDRRARMIVGRWRMSRGGA